MVRFASSFATVCLLLVQLQYFGVYGTGGLNEDCTNDNCTDTAKHVCDTRGSTVCRIKSGVDCTDVNDTNCVSGAACKLNTTAHYICKCVNGTEDTKTKLCGSGPGANCSGNDACNSGTTCDKICKLNLGEDCSGQNSGLCISIATCESNVCRIKAGADCSTDPTACVAGATCEGTLGNKTCACGGGKIANAKTNRCETKGSGSTLVTSCLLLLAGLMVSRFV